MFLQTSCLKQDLDHREARLAEERELALQDQVDASQAHIKVR